jgi:hypothetical protein
MFHLLRRNANYLRNFDALLVERLIINFNEDMLPPNGKYHTPKEKKSNIGNFIHHHDVNLNKV